MRKKAERCCKIFMSLISSNLSTTTWLQQSCTGVSHERVSDCDCCCFCCWCCCVELCCLSRLTPDDPTPASPCALVHRRSLLSPAGTSGTSRVVSRFSRGCCVSMFFIMRFSCETRNSKPISIFSSDAAAVHAVHDEACIHATAQLYEVFFMKNQHGQLFISITAVLLDVLDADYYGGP